MKTTKYSKLPLKEKLISKIMVFYQTVWLEKKLTSSNHKKWLSNFQENEHLGCIYLLSKFMFFGQDEIRELLVSLFRDKFRYSIIESYRKANNDTKDITVIENAFKKELSETRFVGLGKASESGSMLLYMFRQVNKLSVSNMKSEVDLLTTGVLSEPLVRNYIFIDDFCGSGETAIKCKTTISALKRLNPNIKVSYYALFATEDGISAVTNYSNFDRIETAFTLDSSFQCFNINSRYFTENYSEIDQAFCKSFSEKYGYNLVKGTPVEGHPLGFANGQLLLGFSHNTPDNSLPIFWSENDWTPFFLRYIKK